MNKKKQPGKPKLPHPVAYKGKDGQQVYLYRDWDLSSSDELDVGPDWEMVEQLPGWVDQLLSSRPVKYAQAKHDDGFALLVDGERHQYLGWWYCDWGTHGQGSAQYYQRYFRRRKDPDDA